jgi:hypothetical protein
VALSIVEGGGGGGEAVGAPPRPQVGQRVVPEGRSRPAVV